jgi:DNA polymerase-3 subunit epsilon
MGCFPGDIHISEVDELKQCLTPYTENEYIKSMVFQYAERYPYKKVEFAISGVSMNNFS